MLERADRSNPQGSRRDAAGTRVLLAEDDREARSLLAFALRKDGHTVVEAASGAELWSTLDLAVNGGAGPALPDVVVADINMPGCSGLDVLAWLRAGGCDVPMILITAFGDADLHAAALRLGAARLLDKPFDVATLRAAVRAALKAEAAASPDGAR